ncbi:MAG: HYR domain-containing protein [Planctomycetes bacterium]|nr:HYR domain-containing protein [Planctomycetota bacterium]
MSHPTRFPRSTTSSLGLGLVLAAWLLTSPLPGGNGFILVWEDVDGNFEPQPGRKFGEIFMTVTFAFPPSEEIRWQLREEITEASRILWDSTDGRIRIGDVTFACSPVVEDEAAMLVLPMGGRSRAEMFGNRDDGYHKGLFTLGHHVTLFADDIVALTIAHELGHLALGLGDEYDDQDRSELGDCWGYGQCLHPDLMSEVDQCLMQKNSAHLDPERGIDFSELCSFANHDWDIGDCLSCEEEPVPDIPGCEEENCGYFNHGCELEEDECERYATTQQHAIYAPACGVDDDGDGLQDHFEADTSCWTRLTQTFDWFELFDGPTPEADRPPDFQDPDFHEDCAAADTVMLLLDRSLSMSWSTRGRREEVCDNGEDDDGDGEVDGDDPEGCTQSRLEFLWAAAEAFLDLVADHGLRAGITSFNCDPIAEPDLSIRDLTPGEVLEADFLPVVFTLVPEGTTAIGDALEATREPLGAEAEGANKAVFLISDGEHNCGDLTPEAAAENLRGDDIEVYTLSTLESSESDTLGYVAGATGGSHVDSRDMRGIVNAVVLQWANYRNAGVLIPKLPYRVDRFSTSEESPRLERGPEHWVQGADGAAGSSTAPPPRNNRFHALVEEGTEELTLCLAGAMDDMTGFGVHVRAEGPAGPGPRLFDSEVSDPRLDVLRRAFYLLFKVRDPNPGIWRIDVRAAAGAAPLQTGNLTAVCRNPRTDLFSSLDRNVVEDPAQPVELRLVPKFHTLLLGLERLEATLKRPDGSVVPIALEDGTARGCAYSGLIRDMPFQGMYEVRVGVLTGPRTINHPGESIFAPSPSNSVVVPPLQRTAVLYFFVKSGVKVCRSGDPRDCDGDGIVAESCTQDADGDGRPDCDDSDSDADDIPDGVEWRGQPTDLDKDGAPDHIDADADGDGIHDASDPSIALRTPATPPFNRLRLQDAVVPACGGTARSYVLLDTEDLVAGLSIGLRWKPAEFLELVEVLPGPDVARDGLSSFYATVERKDLGLGAGEAIAALVLKKGSMVGPRAGLRVLELRWRPRAAAEDGSRGEVCFADDLGVRAIDTVLAAARGERIVTVIPRTSCGAVTLERDSTPPTIICPEGIAVTVVTGGVELDYEVDAKDDCGPVEVLCTPPSGSLFPPGTTEVLCRAEDAAGNVAFCSFLVQVHVLAPVIVFRRGDANGDDKVDLSDGVATLSYLFLGGPPPACFEAANANDDLELGLADAVFTFNYLFLGGPEPPAPGPRDCGPDPTPASSALGPCRYERCP